MSVQPQIITATQAAKILGISPTMVRKHLNNGRLDGWNIEGRWLLTRQRVMAFQKIKRQAGRPRKVNNGN